MSIKATMSPSGRSRHFERAQTTSGSLIGRLGSSAFTLSITTVSMSLTGSCFSSESAPRALVWGFFSQEVFMQSSTSFSLWRRLGGRDDDQRGARFRARFNRATTLYPVGPRT